MSLMELLEKVPEFRRQQALRYPVAGMLALIAIASFAGVAHGQRDLAAFAGTLSQAQMRALKFRMRRSEMAPATLSGAEGKKQRATLRGRDGPGV